jgi:hypothetical protein
MKRLERVKRSGSKFSRVFFSVKTTICVSKLNFELDALLDVSLDIRPLLNSARVPLKTRFRLYGNP